MQLAKSEIKIIKSILRELLPTAEVWIFGSRAQDQGGKYSDIDILLKIPKPIPFNVMFKLRDAFAESNLIFKVDLVDWQRVTPEFRASILQDAKKI